MLKNKRNTIKKRSLAKVYHRDLWGIRDKKYDWLLSNEHQLNEYLEISPQSPFYLFTPQDDKRSSEYELGWKVIDIFPENSMGVTTGDDGKFVGFTKEEIISEFDEIEKFINFAYRPFDTRILYYDPKLLARARESFMFHLREGNNLA